MSLMLRLLSISAATAILSFAATNAQVEKFIKRGLSSNPHIKVKSVEVVDKRALKNPKGWEAYFVNFKLSLQRGKKSFNINQNDILFANGNLIAPDLIDINTNRSLKKSLSPSIKPTIYNKEHLLYGNKDAKHKILVFSDPVCPFCKDYVPPLIDVAKKYPNTFALYYYHFPLTRIHPAAPIISKAMIVLQKNGKKDLIEKIYKTNFNFREKNETKILDELNKKLKTNLTLKDINREWVKKSLENDIENGNRLFVRGTPTVYFDSKKDPSISKYKKYIPKK